MVLAQRKSDIKNLMPKLGLLNQIENALGIIVTDKGEDCDFVSRYFAPNAGVAENPVTGSAHCRLIPFWSKRFRKGRNDSKAAF